MTDPVNVNRSSRPDPVGKARAAWGDDAPEWVMILAEECGRTNQARTARRTGLHDSVVSSVLGRNCAAYNLDKIEAAVRAALTAETVDCPELLEIPLAQCLWEQKQPFSTASALRATMYRRCRSGCPHSRIKGADDALVDDPS